MIAKALVLVFSWTTLFNLPLCCCSEDHCSENEAPLKESCGHHCPEKNSSHSERHDAPGKQAPSLPGSDDCGCSHVVKDVSVETVRISFVVPSDPAAWEDAPLNSNAMPPSSPEIAPFFDRGPPPDRLSVPIYLSVLHLAI